jgi:hypothetical protein
MALVSHVRLDALRSKYLSFDYLARRPIDDEVNATKGTRALVSSGDCNTVYVVRYTAIDMPTHNMINQTLGQSLGNAHYFTLHETG